MHEKKEKNASTKQLRTETKIKSQWKYKITQNRTELSIGGEAGQFKDRNLEQLKFYWMEKYDQ